MGISRKKEAALERIGQRVARIVDKHLAQFSPEKRRELLKRGREVVDSLKAGVVDA